MPKDHKDTKLILVTLTLARHVHTSTATADEQIGPPGHRGATMGCQIGSAVIQRYTGIEATQR